MEELEEIKTRLRKALNARGMTQNELSKKTCIPKASISQYLSGYAKPKDNRIYEISEALEIDPVWLLGYDVPMEKSKVNYDELLELLDNYCTAKDIEKITAFTKDLVRK
jgi:transcriptional regulator with XRE-family HTH domain